MKCSKCGAECREGLNFCLRCGTPIPKIPDSGELEEELKENVGDAMKDVKEVRVPFSDLVDTIDIEEDDEPDYDDDEELDLAIGRDLSGYGSAKDRGDEKEKSAPEKKKKGFFKNRRNVVIVSIIAAVIIAAVVFIVVTLVNNNKSYGQYYNAGLEYMSESEYKSAAKQFEKAAEVAETDDQRIAAYEMMWSAYSQLTGYEEEQMEALRALIELNPTEITYYQALLLLYQDAGMTDEMDELIASIEDDDLKSELKEYDTTMPVATTAEGTYSEAITIGLSSLADRDIYYTLDGTTPDESSTKYTAAIELSDEGTYTLMAVSVDSEGSRSAVFSATYVIDFGSVAAPVVNLDSGTYNTQKKIKVTADDGLTIYYTTDGTTPTTSSTEYVKSFYMAEGNNVYSFIAVNSDGVSSQVVSRIYILEPGYTYTYASAAEKLTSTLVSWGIMENSYGEFSDGSYMYLSYTTTTLVDHDYYYIICAEKVSAEGSTTSTKYYAFGVDSAEIYTASNGDDGYEISGLSDE